MENELALSQNQNTDASATVQPDAVPPLPAGRVQTILVGNQRLLLAIAGALLIMGFASLAFWSAKPPYRPVFTGMSEKEASNVVNFLQKSHIPYRLEGGGIVMVPNDQVYMARLKLAGQGLTPGSGHGYELFDRKGSFGISDFVQKVNLQRALQAELARTIEVMSQVSAARVQLVMPKDSAFAGRERHASASVMLQLVGERSLPANTILGIQNLVAAGVPDLKPEAVTIVDSSGDLLTIKKQNGVANEHPMTANQTRFEHRLETRLTSMLEKIVGAGQAVVRVSADMTQAVVEQNSQRFDPDGAVLRSQKVITEDRSSPGSKTSGGAAGIASNVPPAATSNPPANGAKAATAGAKLATGTVQTPMNKASRKEQSNSYEISSTTEKRIIPAGILKKISVAVIVGGSFKKGKNGQVFIPRSKQEMKSIRNLVERAVGYNEDRGDSIEVQSMPLVKVSDSRDAASLVAAQKRTFYLTIARYGVAALALILLVWFVLRPISKRVASGFEKPEDTATNAREAIGSMSAATTPAISVEDAALQQSARDTALRDPDATAMVIHQWLRDEA